MEANNSYPVLFYFRYRQAYYALSRIIYLAMDIATLIKSTLDEEQYRSVTRSSGVAELWYGGKHLLKELERSLLPRMQVQSQEDDEALWRSHYYQALERLQAEGIQTVTDPETGANEYVALRRQWASRLAKLMKYMVYEPDDIFPTEYPESLRLSRSVMSGRSLSRL